MYTEIDDLDFESLVRRLLNSEAQKGSRDSHTNKKQVNRFGSPHGEDREVVIRYQIGDEQNAVLSVHSDGTHGAAEDSLAVAYALGQLAKRGITNHETDASDISSKTISLHIINAMMDGIAEEIHKSLLRIIKREV